MDLKRIRGLFREIFSHDFVVTYPARELVVLARYRPLEAGLPEGKVLVASMREVRWISWFARRPVILWPVLADIMAEQKRDYGAGRSSYRRFALAMAHLRRRHPVRYRKAWRLPNRGPGIAQALIRRWMLRSVSRADFVVAGWNSAAAIFYRGGSGGPRVLAMGIRGVARAIRSQAEEHGILMVENEACVQALLDEGWPCEQAPEECWESLIGVMRELVEKEPRFLNRWKCLAGEDKEGEE